MRTLTVVRTRQGRDERELSGFAGSEMSTEKKPPRLQVGLAQEFRYAVCLKTATSAICPGTTAGWPGSG